MPDFKGNYHIIPSHDFGEYFSEMKFPIRMCEKNASKKCWTFLMRDYILTIFGPRKRNPIKNLYLPMRRNRLEKYFPIIFFADFQAFAILRINSNNSHSFVHWTVKWGRFAINHFHTSALYIILLCGFKTNIRIAFSCV